MYKLDKHMLPSNVKQQLFRQYTRCRGVTLPSPYYSTVPEACLLFQIERYIRNFCTPSFFDELWRLQHAKINNWSKNASVAENKWIRNYPVWRF